MSREPFVADVGRTFGDVGGTLVEPWAALGNLGKTLGMSAEPWWNLGQPWGISWNLGGTLEEPSRNLGKTLVEPWENIGGTSEEP